VPVVALACAAGAAGQLTGVLSGAEQASVGARFHVRGADRPADVAVVGIDAKTFGTLREQWPFRRSLHGDVMRRLHAAGAREIVYDVQFTEPSTPKEDDALYRAVGDVGGATLATSESDDRGHTRVLGGDENLRAVHARAAASDLSDEGTAVTRFHREVSHLPTMAVTAGRRAGGPALGAGLFSGDGALIDYRGPPGTIRTLSYSDVLRGHFPASAVRGRVVVVGATAPTLRDVHSTPVGGGLMAGAEVQANAIWTAMHGIPLRGAPPWTTVVLLAAMALVAPLAGSFLRGGVAAILVMAVAGAFLVAAQLAFGAGTVIAVAAPLLSLVVGAVGFIAVSRLWERRARLDTLRANAELEARVRERTDQLWQGQLELVRRLGTAVDWRDGETGDHVNRIGRTCERLGLAVGMDATEAELLRHASVLHDVGKVGIPDRILNKPGPLDPDEWEVMKTHTTIGGNILAESGFELVQLACTIALTHHESWAGGGYPAGLSGREIPLAGRICAIADVFDALASPRPYKDPWPLPAILDEMRRMRGDKFDPELLDLFLPMAPELYAESFGDPAEAEPAPAP
jgi:CHASE2 domain-containing sensor protein